MAKKFIFSLLALSFIGACLVHATPVQAEGNLTVIGHLPTDQCAAVAASARMTGGATKSEMTLCNQAVTWARSQPLDYPGALLNRGVLHLVRAEYSAAIADIDEAIKYGAQRSVALNDRGAVEAALHQYQAAVEDFTQALAAGASHPEIVYYNRALAFEDLGNMKRAYLDCKKASELNPEWDASAKELARFSVAPASAVQ